MEFTHRIDQSKFRILDIKNSQDDYLTKVDRAEFFEMIWYWPLGKQARELHHICLIPPFRSFEFSFEARGGYLIAFKREYLEEDEQEYALDVFNLFNAQGQWSVFELDSVVTDNLSHVYSLIKFEVSNPLGSYLVLKSLLKVFILHLVRMNQNAFLAQDINQKRVYNFCVLLDRHYDKERKNNFYAEKLGLSEKRLNQVLFEKTGKTVTGLIHGRLVLEAKRKLISGKLTIKEIAYGLNFQDHSYFTRFFKKQTGMTPEEFKAQLRQ